MHTTFLCFCPAPPGCHESIEYSSVKRVVYCLDANIHCQYHLYAKRANKITSTLIFSFHFKPSSCWNCLCACQRDVLRDTWAPAVSEFKTETAFEDLRLGKPTTQQNCFIQATNRSPKKQLFFTRRKKKFSMSLAFFVHKTAGMGVFPCDSWLFQSTARQLPAAVRRPQETTGLSGCSRVESLASLHPSSCLHLGSCLTELCIENFLSVLPPFLTWLFVANIAAASHARLDVTKVQIQPNTGDEHLLLMPLHIWCNHTPVIPHVICSNVWPLFLYVSSLVLGQTCSVFDKRVLAGPVWAGWIWIALSLGSRRNRVNRCYKLESDLSFAELSFLTALLEVSFPFILLLYLFACIYVFLFFDSAPFFSPSPSLMHSCPV